MKFIPDQDGWYKAHPDDEGWRLCPIDTTDEKTWSDSIMMRAKNVLKYGLGNLSPDGTPYSLSTFLYDTFGGAMPHNTKMHTAVLNHCMACIEYKWIMTEFYRVYGVIYLPILIEDLAREIKEQSC